MKAHSYKKKTKLSFLEASGTILGDFILNLSCWEVFKIEFSPV